MPEQIDKSPTLENIILPSNLTYEQRRLLVKYAKLPRSVTRLEWPLALLAFDRLSARGKP